MSLSQFVSCNWRISHFGFILCKKADRAYAEYIMQDFRQPMGVATYKTADEMEPELLKVLPPKEELQRIFEESSKQEEGHR